MRIAVNRIHYPVTSLGHGKRVGIWVQGCSIRCPGCAAIDTWETDNEREIATERVVDLCREMTGDDIDGITISGGEPFDQADALHELLVHLRRWAGGLDRDIDILCFSGRSAHVLRRAHTPTLALLDAVVAGPYLRHRPTDQGLRGSDNQRLLALTDLGQARYASLDTRRRIQLSPTAGGLLMIGIPRIGDLDRLEACASSAGVELRETTWRS